MKSRNRWGIGAFATLAVPAAAVFLWPEAWWPLLLFVVWAAAAAVCWAAQDKREVRRQNVRMLEHARLSAIRTLSHHRHDWMNDLQILYGYLRLNKPDKAVEIVDRIRERMEMDSKISGIGNAELATFLLSFRTMCDHMRLDVQIEDGLQLDRLRLDDERVASVLIGVVNAVRYRTVPASSGDNVFNLTMFVTNSALKATMTYAGEWAAGNSMAAVTANLLNGAGHLTEEHTGGNDDPSRSVTVVFPLTA